MKTLALEVLTSVAMKMILVPASERAESPGERERIAPRLAMF
jgi:hypothetical protein